MRKYFNVLIFLIILACLTSSCQKQENAVVIKSKNTFEKYKKINNNDKKNYDNIIDLSEGPKLHYDKYLGPKPLNFDFKIINPY